MMCGEHTFGRLVKAMLMSGRSSRFFNIFPNEYPPNFSGKPMEACH